MTGNKPGLTSPPPVLDSEAGIDRLMGNRGLYLRVLARFRSDYRDAATAIRSALDSHDTPLAQRLAHTLKGAAGMIEASALHGAALALDDALRGGKLDTGTPLLRLEAALADLLHTLDGMDLMAQARPPRAPAPARGHTLPNLRAMLDSGDGAAVDLVAAARSELSELLGEREYAALNAAVADFEYERALELLDRPGQGHS